jgi:hypothetical protein
VAKNDKQWAISGRRLLPIRVMVNRDEHLAEFNHCASESAGLVDGGQRPSRLIGFKRALCAGSSELSRDAVEVFPVPFSTFFVRDCLRHADDIV